jgi:cell division septum initiation protein DivIVA
MILNNSGIVHCATRTRGREETAMNMQELLTYVEELTFKTSMFGYDKDEVDIQLDKICDEAEAIILAKEKEIEELKKESKTALGIAAAATGKTMEELEKDTQEDIVETEEEEQTVTLDEAEETVQETVSNEVPISTVAVADADEAQDEIETVRAQLVAAQKKVAALEAEIAAEKEKTEKAIARAEEAEKSAENNKAPETTDQAYERYMKNADLLCKQLSDLEGRQNAILDEAREQAEREREKARQDAADIIGEARKTAERLLKDAQENKENAIEEAKKIHEDSLRKVEEEKKQCDELSAQKAAMVNSLKKLTEDTARLMEKMQG